MNIGQTLVKATQQLYDISATPALDASMLLGYATQTSKAFLYAWPEKSINAAEYNKFQILLARRLAREPIAYILRQKEFWSMRLVVSQDTLIPRPETELLVELLLNPMFAKSSKQILELGTGCGAIALALAKERPNWRILATELCEKALTVAKYNAKAHRLLNIEYLQSNWFANLPDTQFDAIVANPPYIPTHEYFQRASELGFEPRDALESGSSGLEALSDIISGSPRFLVSGGYLCLEHGYQQQPQVEKLLRTKGYCQIQSHTDLAGRPRAVIARIVCE